MRRNRTKIRKTLKLATKMRVAILIVMSIIIGLLTHGGEWMWYPIGSLIALIFMSIIKK